jgi:predicted acylesterase/phospholipase RssA
VALSVPDPFNVVERLERLDGLRRQLLPLPLVDRPKRIDTAVFDAFEARPATGLRGRRVGLVASGGSGAAVALVGVRRAFEEAGVELEAISACSGSVLWSAMWAAGLTAQEMADFSLSWQPEDYLDIQWTGLPRFALSALRGFTGLPTGEALEQLFDRRLWHMAAGETDIALSTVVYELERGRVRWFGSEETPDLTLGELVRIAAAAPHAAEAVRVEGTLYVDGGVVDAFPAEPLAGLDRVFGVDVTRRVDGSGTLESAQRAELARRSRERLGESLSLIEPIPPEELHGSAFYYDLFLDRRRWPDLMRRGYSAAVAALAPFSGRRRRS